MQGEPRVAEEPHVHGTCKTNIFACESRYVYMPEWWNR